MSARNAWHVKAMMDEKHLLEEAGLHPEDDPNKRFPYRQFPTVGLDDVTQNKNLVFQVLLIGLANKLSKRPGGMKLIETLGKATIKGLFDTLDSLGQASAANSVAAWANPVLISGIFERFGMLPPQFNAGYHAGITTISGVDIVTGVISDILGAKGSFPESIAFAKKVEAQEAAIESRMELTEKLMNK